MATPTCVEIKQEWDIVHARQQGRELAKKLGFGHVDQARITTAISELARNIYLYAKHGFITVEPVDVKGKTGLKIVAKDDGPGIKDVRRAMEDGFTTSGGLGAGLPGVKRLMDEFNLETRVGEGTTITALKFLR